MTTKTRVARVERAAAQKNPPEEVHIEVCWDSNWERLPDGTYQDKETGSIYTKQQLRKKDICILEWLTPVSSAPVLQCSRDTGTRDT